MDAYVMRPLCARLVCDYSDAVSCSFVIVMSHRAEDVIIIVNNQTSSNSRRSSSTSGLVSCRQCYVSVTLWRDLMRHPAFTPCHHQSLTHTAVCQWSRLNGTMSRKRVVHDNVSTSSTSTTCHDIADVDLATTTYVTLVRVRNAGITEHFYEILEKLRSGTGISR